MHPSLGIQWGVAKAVSVGCNLSIWSQAVGEYRKESLMINQELIKPKQSFVRCEPKKESDKENSDVTDEPEVCGVKEQDTGPGSALEGGGRRLAPPHPKSACRAGKPGGGAAAGRGSGFEDQDLLLPVRHTP